jgi:hypothetical protein
MLLQSGCTLAMRPPCARRKIFFVCRNRLFLRSILCTDSPTIAVIPASVWHVLDEVVAIGVLEPSGAANLGVSGRVLAIPPLLHDVPYVNRLFYMQDKAPFIALLHLAAANRSTAGQHKQ